MAVVTGAAAGIGRATAELFAEEGARVVLADLAGEAVERVAAGIRETGAEAVSVAADVSTEEGAEEVVGTAERRFGPVDVLVNNAGVELKRLVEDTTLEEWNRILRVNLTSAFLMSRRVVPSYEGAAERRDRDELIGGDLHRGRWHFRIRGVEGRDDGPGPGTGDRGRSLWDPGERGMPGRDRHAHERAEPVQGRGPGSHAAVLVRHHATGTDGNSPRCGTGHAVFVKRRVELRHGVAASHRRRENDPLVSCGEGFAGPRQLDGCHLFVDLGPAVAVEGPVAANLFHHAQVQLAHQHLVLGVRGGLAHYLPAGIREI